MARFLRCFLSINLFFILVLSGCGPAAALSLSVLEPSVWETVMESGRDFYVIGKIDREGKSAAEQPFDIRVEVCVTGLVRDGQRIPLRTVQSRVDRKSGVTPARDIRFDYEGKAPWSNFSRQELMKSPPPDLVYHFEDPESFRDPRVKAVVTEESYAVLVQGGVTKDFDTDYRKYYSDDLEWKLYRVFVMAVSGDRVLAEREMDITFGSVQDKVLARFSPPEHFNKVKSLAAERGYRMYLNSFPGYWNFGLSGTYEIPLRWRRNDALEYISGRVHAMLYNIPQTRSTAQDVELGHIAYEGWLESDEIVYYRYDVGEPSILYREYGENKIREGVLVPFEHGDRLAFTRVSFSPAQNANTCLNFYSQEAAFSDYYPGDPERIEWAPVNAIRIGRNELFRLYGVVTPIQPRLSEVEENDDGTYTIGNRIAKVRYEFVDGITGNIAYAAEMPAQLTRRYRGGGEARAYDSAYEFRHEFLLPRSLFGRIFTVNVKAYDACNEPVCGSEEDFFVRVR